MILMLFVIPSLLIACIPPSIIIVPVAINSIVYFSYLLTTIFAKKRLYIDRDRLILTRKAYSFPFRQNVSCSRKDIVDIEIIPEILQFYTNLSLKIGTTKRQLKFFDSYFPLTNREVEWLAQELSEWLNLPIIR